MWEFENEFGKFPDASTIASVKSRTSSSLVLGTATSNDYFRQLLAAEIGNENMFYSKIKGAVKPDNISTGLKALEKGECGFSYILGAGPMSPADRPIAVTPLIPGTLRFDSKPFDKRAVVVCCDGSARTIIINRHGNAMIAGKNIFDPSNPCWGGVPPVIVWPE